MKNDTSFIRVSPLRIFAAVFFLSACASPPPAPPAEAMAPVPEAAPEAVAPEIDTPPVVETVELKPQVPLRYTVKKGDTLWSIAGYFLRDPWQWPELWFVNPKLQNPHRLYPGDELELFFKDGRPLLARAGDAAALQAEEPLPNVEKLSPTIRTEDLAQAIPAIPIDAIRSYLQGPRLVGDSEPAAYVLGFVDAQIFGAAGASVYVRGLGVLNGGPPYAVVRMGEAYEDPDDGTRIGYEAIPVAEADLLADGDPATVRLRKSFRETRRGDLLLDIESELFAAQFYPHVPEKPVRGRLISVFNGLSQIGQYQIVAINRGSDAGLEPGHVLHIFQAGREAEDPVTGRDVALPDLKAGTLMVFKVAPRLSYGLVMSATRAIHVLDTVEKP